MLFKANIPDPDGADPADYVALPLIACTITVFYFKIRDKKNFKIRLSILKNKKRKTYDI